MKKWNLIVDVAECHNCNNCVISCTDEYVGNDIPGYSAPQPLHGHKWIDITTLERGEFPRVDVTYVPTMCNHCDDAPCVAAGKGAVTKRDDGIVIIDPQKARGRKDIVDACPYGAIWWNDDLDLPQAWTFDAHLLDRGWKHPRCVQSCPTQALKSLKVTDAEMAAMIAEEDLRPLRPDLATKPRVHYKNLHRFDTVFVAGEVLATANGVTDCVAEALVTLSSKGQQLASTHTCGFGEFTLDGLPPLTGDCDLTITLAGYEPKTINIALQDTSIVIEPVVLS